MPTDPYNLIIAICTIILCLAGVFGVITYFFTAKNRKASKAMDLVCYFVDIIPIFSFLFRCANESTVNEIRSDLEKKGKALFFLRDEMEKIFQRTSILEKYDQLYDDISLEEIEAKYLTRQQTLSFFDAFYKAIIKPAIDSGDPLKKEQAKKSFSAYAKAVGANLVNKLEYFAMSFLTIGDQKIVYSSIHQTFIIMTQFFYITMSKQNRSFHEYYFMNIQKLYLKWANKQNKYELQNLKDRGRLYRLYGQ